MIEKVLFVLLAMAAGPLGQGDTQTKPADLLVRGIQQVEEGDLEAAATTLDAAIRGLSGASGGEKDLARAHLYLGIAHLGLGEAERALVQMRAARGADAELRLDPKRFSPRVIQAFEAAKTSETKPAPPPLEQKPEAAPPTQSEPSPSPRKAPTPSPAADEVVGDRAECVLPGRYTALRVKVPEGFKPGGRLYFKSNLSTEYFYTELKSEGLVRVGLIPKVNQDGGIRELTYYFRVADASSGAVETPAQTIRVVRNISECPAGRVEEAATTSGPLSVLSATGSKAGNLYSMRSPVAPSRSEPRAADSQTDSADLVLPIADAFGFQSLQEGLKDTDPAVRSATAQSLEEMAGLIVRAIGESVVRLRSKDSGDRQQAGRDLTRTARQSVKGTADALIALMGDKVPETRRSVAAILGSLGESLARARTALSGAIKDSDKDVRLAATQALTAMGSVLTTTATALKTAEAKEPDAQTADAMRKARRGIEGALAGESAVTK